MMNKVRITLCVVVIMLNCIIELSQSLKDFPKELKFLQAEVEGGLSGYVIKPNIKTERNGQCDITYLKRRNIVIDRDVLKLK